MAERHNGLTRSVADSLTEGARVCLERHHAPPTAFAIKGSDKQMGVIVQWEPTSERTKAAWNNSIDATEAGACACVLAAVELFDGLVAVRRAETGSGADYYLAPPDTSLEDLEDCIRLKVSGVDRGNASAVERRLRNKATQVASGNGNFPAIAGVTGFLARIIRLSHLEQP